MVDSFVNRFRLAFDGALTKKSVIHWALTGGRSPLPFYHALTLQRGLDWSRVHFWFSDERCVSPDDPLSNFGAVNHILFEPLSIPNVQIHRMYGELGKTVGAQRYDETLHAFFSDCVLPEMDILLLGMGDDGHVASLFPDRLMVSADEPWAVAVDAPSHIEPHVDRISMTLPVLNHAANIFLMISGEEKQSLYKRTLSGGSNLPVHLLDRAKTELIFI